MRNLDNGTKAYTRQSFLDNAVRPSLGRYGRNRNVIASGVMNEPEGAMDIDGGRWVVEPVSISTIQIFVNNLVAYIHTYSSQLATVASALRQWLGYWTNSKLDFYQYRYYDKMESTYPLDSPYSKLDLDKPCIVGEFPTKNSKRTMIQYLNTIWKNGYAGPWPGAIGQGIRLLTLRVLPTNLPYGHGLTKLRPILHF